MSDCGVYKDIKKYKPLILEEEKKDDIIEKQIELVQENRVEEEIIIDQETES